MSVVFNRKTRRQFLVGTGNTLLALPFLPSLFGSDALAQMAAPNTSRMMTFVFDHPMLYDYWLPTTAATNPVGSSGAKEVLLKTLSSLSAVSPNLTNPILDQLRLNDKMTIVRGLDKQAGVGHENYSHFGGSFNECPTFDTIIEDSPTIYPVGTPGSVTRALRVDFSTNRLSTRKVGNEYQEVVPYGFDQNGGYHLEFYSLPIMYNDVFKSLTAGTAAAEEMTNKFKTNILNRVYESYRSFKASRRISSDDLARLDQHMGFLSDLQKSLNVTVQAPICDKPAVPTGSYNPLIYTPLYLDLMTVAFKCGLTKFGAMKLEGHDPQWLPNLMLPEGTGVHGAVHGGETPAQWLLKRHAHNTLDQYNFNNALGRFLTSMNEVEGNTGRTYLDNMVTAVLPKFGMEPGDGGSGHPGSDTQSMLFGTMGGKMRAGRYINYPFTGYGGLPYNAMIVTLLDLMGVPRSEYVKYSNVGAGYGLYGSKAESAYASRFYENLSELMA